MKKKINKFLFIFTLLLSTAVIAEETFDAKSVRIELDRGESFYNASIGLPSLGTNFVTPSTRNQPSPVKNEDERFYQQLMKYFRYYGKMIIEGVQDKKIIIPVVMQQPIDIIGFNAGVSKVNKLHFKIGNFNGLQIKDLLFEYQGVETGLALPFGGSHCKLLGNGNNKGAYLYGCDIRKGLDLTLIKASIFQIYISDAKQFDNPKTQESFDKLSEIVLYEVE